MSSINFNDFASYVNYDSGYDFSALMGGTVNSSGNLLSDYASIQNGSYGKLLKAYYATQDAESAATSGDTPQKLTLMRSSADSLKKSADALNNSSLWEKKKDSITKAVKSFIEDYNAVVEQAGDSDTKNVLRNAAWMTSITGQAQNLLSQVGITVGKGNKLELDEDVFKKANSTTLKSLFTGYGSFADQISQKAGSISNAAARTKGVDQTYTRSGRYSDPLSKLFSSTIDEKVGDQDKRSDTSSKTADREKEILKIHNQFDYFSTI